MDQGSSMSARVAADGRIVIPASFRRALGIHAGDEVVLYLEEDGIRVSSPTQSLERLQDRVARAVPKGVSLAKELIRERRDEIRGG